MKENKLLRFITLGPDGSNHQFVTREYIRFHGLENVSTIELVLDFDDAAMRVINGEADHFIQVAVHPSTAQTTARYRKEIFVIDAFVSPSKPMAVVTRVDVERATTLALQPATREYVDTSELQLIPETSVGSVAQGLLENRYESGLTYSALAEDHPDRFRIDVEIGTVDDAWLVYGKERISNGHLVSWKDSPAARLFGQEMNITV